MAYDLAGVYGAEAVNVSRRHFSESFAEELGKSAARGVILTASALILLLADFLTR